MRISHHLHKRLQLVVIIGVIICRLYMKMRDRVDHQQRQQDNSFSSTPTRMTTVTPWSLALRWELSAAELI